MARPDHDVEILHNIAPVMTHSAQGGLAMRFLPPETFVGILLDDVIDEPRCAELIAELEGRGFAATGERYPRGYRDNDRLVFDDPVLAASLFEELGDRLPAELTVDGVRWALCGLNTRF